MSVKLIYQHPADNLLPSASAVTVPSGTEDPLYPAANLFDLNPALPMKFSTQTGRIVFDFGSAVSAKFVALLHHNLDAGLEVRIQGNAANSWGAPTLNVAFTIGAKDGEGYRPNVWLDLSAQSSTTFRYWSIVVVGTNTNNIIIGEAWLGAVLRQLVHNYAWGAKLSDQRPRRKTFETNYGVKWTYPSAGRRRRLESSIRTTDSSLALVRDWHRACGGPDQPMIIVPDPSVDEAWMVFWDVDWTNAQNFVNDNEIPVAWLEAARGFWWPA